MEIKTKEDYLTYKSETLKEASAKLINARITGKTRGAGRIIAVTDFSDNSALNSVDLKTDIRFDDKTTGTIVIGLALERGSYALEDSELVGYVKSTLADMQVAYKSFLNVLSIEWAERERAAKEERAAKKLEEDRKKKEAAAKIRQEKVMAELTKLSKGKKSATSEFYEGLGWLSKHVGTVSATVPDFAESWFKSVFGNDAPVSVVDSRLKTSGGYSMQWNASFRCSVKNSETAPISISELLNESKKSINNTSFIYNLVKNYGFKFGKVQDLDSILEEVPAEYVDAFTAGATL